MIAGGVFGHHHLLGVLAGIEALAPQGEDFGLAWFGNQDRRPAMALPRAGVRVVESGPAARIWLPGRGRDWKRSNPPHNARIVNV